MVKLDFLFSNAVGSNTYMGKGFRKSAYNHIRLPYHPENNSGLYENSPYIRGRAIFGIIRYGYMSSLHFLLDQNYFPHLHGLYEGEGVWINYLASPYLPLPSAYVYSSSKLKNEKHPRKVVHRCVRAKFRV